MRILLSMALSGLLLAACTDGGQGPLPDAVESVVIEPDSVDIIVGGSQALTTTVYGRNGVVLQGRAVNWSMDVNAVASLDANGTVTGVAEGVVTLTATSGGKSGRTVVVVHAAPGTTDPVSVQTVTLAEAIEGRAYNQQLEAVGGSGSYSWVLAAGSLPAGLTLSPSGMIAGTPVGPGTASFRVRVTDTGDLSATADLSIPVVQALAVHSWRLPDGEVGAAYTAQLQAVGGRGTLTWTVTGEAANWMTVSAAGVITGTPMTSGVQTVTVGVADESGQQATRQIPIVVRDRLAVVDISLPAATQGRAYAAQLVATGGDGAYSWSLKNGVLPAGVTLTAGGALTGIPADGGEFSFTVQVTDGADRAATRDLTLTVARAPTIQTALLPAGDVDSPYSAQLQATGGTGAYTWSVIEGTLPAGLAVSSGGAITGTPMTLGSSTFTVRVADAAGATHSRTLTIVIAQIDALSNGVAITGIGGAAGSNRYYSIVVPAGTTQLTFATSGGTGDVDLYIRYGSLPQEYVYDCRPFRPGNDETCTVPAPAAGPWYVMLRGHGDYADVRLVASLND
ncbi:MAG TPA: putative Ig domain-containing protein [Longimicrobiales bacterium]|nr:putative Ig domain-containing protein [Longimicrobiales bacterium]